MVPNIVDDHLQTIEEKLNIIETSQDKKNKLNFSDMGNSALGTVFADTAVYGMKKALTPHTLPATKGDIEEMRREFNILKQLIQANNKNKFQFPR